MNLQEWANYGDVNPMEHGGQWLKQDEDCTECFHIVTWEPLDEGEANGVVSEGYVDMSDDWFDLNEVGEWAGWTSYTPVHQKALDLFRFYGAAHFGGSSEIITPEEMVNQLWDREIWTEGK